MRLTMPALISFALPCAMLGCSPDRAIPSQKAPHRLAKPTQATILVRTDKGDFQEQDVTLPAGWWVASPQLVE